MELLTEHKKSLYIGSILPDCIPSFITRRHTIDDTFDILKKELLKITEDYDEEKGINSYFCRHLGVITHYIADYFTFPHNSIYPGSIKEHCVYEEQLKHAFRAYVKSEEAQRIRERTVKFQCADDILTFVKSMHNEYLEVIKEVKVDCQYIVELCHKVVDAVLQFIEIRLTERKLVMA